jgi:hypothetical protein
VHAYAVGIGAAFGAVFPFAIWLTQLSGDQGAGFIAAWLGSVIGFGIVAALLGTLAAWGGREVRWLRG